MCDGRPCATERRWSSYGLSTVIGCDVVTERGTYIGRVRDYEFDPDDGLVQRIVVDALVLPIVPEGREGGRRRGGGRALSSSIHTATLKP